MPTNAIKMKANFVKIANKVSISKSGIGTVTGTGTYNRGEEVTITAEAKSGYEFAGWTNVKGIEINKNAIKDAKHQSENGESNDI
jgi:hypothetical protein